MDGGPATGVRYNIFSAGMSALSHQLEYQALVHHRSRHAAEDAESFQRGDAIDHVKTVRTLCRPPSPRRLRRNGRTQQPDLRVQLVDARRGRVRTLGDALLRWRAAGGQSTGRNKHRVRLALRSGILRLVMRV